MKRRNLILPIASVTAQTISGSHVPRVLVGTNVVNSGAVKSEIPIDLQGTDNQLINQAAGVIDVAGLQVGAGATLTNNGTIEVTVFVAVTGITLPTPQNYNSLGDQPALTATVSPSNAAIKTVGSWTSTDPAVATIDATTGIITVINNGTTNITCQSTNGSSIISSAYAWCRYLTVDTAGSSRNSTLKYTQLSLRCKKWKSVT
ncbi:hypothetical protein FACS1894162_5660 [Bacteroidia bacterium]|nr:hypothetical protein FACS1894162_5660 [Bacteroidia bacterium]